MMAEDFSPPLPPVADASVLSSSSSSSTTPTRATVTTMETVLVPAANETSTITTQVPSSELQEKLTLLHLQEPESLSSRCGLFVEKDAKKPIPLLPPGSPFTSKNPRSSPCTPARGYSKPILPNGTGGSQASSSSNGSSASATARLLNHFLPSSRNSCLDLTPVMRNTSTSATEYVTVSTSTSSTRELSRLISPEEETLQGESFICLPGGSGPSIPLMKHHKEQHDEDIAAPPSLSKPLSMGPCRHFSFTSLQECDTAAATKGDSSAKATLTPYQPSRPEMLEDVPVLAVSSEDLNQIFIPRRTVSVDKQHRFDLDEPIPLDERQESIPSIHLAHNLENGSVTTCGDDDDEDSILKCSFDDDVSWSSRGSKSSLYMDDDQTSWVLPQRVISLPARSTFIPREWNTEDPTNVRRKRKQERAYEWLQSVEAHSTDLAEAASSKFLLTTTHQHDPHSMILPVVTSSTETTESNLQQELEHARVMLPIRPRQFRERRQSSPATML